MLDRSVRPPKEVTEAQPVVRAQVVSPSGFLRGHGLGLASRVLIVTIGSVVLALGLFYSTRLAAYRETWIHNKLATAHAVTDAFAPNGAVVPDELARRILNAADVRLIVVNGPDGHRQIGPEGRLPPGVQTAMINDIFSSIREAVRTLFAPPGSLIRASETGGDEHTIEVTFDEGPLIEGMWRISRTFLAISAIVATVVTCVLWSALWQLVLRPVRRLTSNIIAFGENPQDMSRVIAPTGRRDEIGRAETALAAMQNSLAHELAQRKRLAELGMAVARINHDLRNILSAAQLISDRLASIPDPLAQLLAPRLVATLDRAIRFCQATLTYGGAREQVPKRRRFDLSEKVREVAEAGRAEHGDAIAYQVEIPPRFDVYADPDHVLRVLENLGRNASEALRVNGAQGERPKAIRFAAIRTDGVALIEIGDTGPGFPPNQIQQIFEPFHSSTSADGAGLGLAIAADLVTRNGGSIALAPAKADDFYCGARFLIKLPTPERPARRIASRSPEA
jgi:signal transduction histidine kinase